jgi:hypothetical protein
MAMLTRRLFQVRVSTVRNFSSPLNWDVLTANCITPTAKQELLRAKADYEQTMALAEEYSKPLEPIDFNYYRSRLGNSSLLDYTEMYYQQFQSNECMDDVEIEPDNLSVEAYKDEVIKKLFEKFKVYEMLDSVKTSQYTPETLQLMKDSFVQDIKKDFRELLDHAGQEYKVYPKLEDVVASIKKLSAKMQEEVDKDKIRLKNLNSHAELFRKFRTNKNTTNDELLMLYPAMLFADTYDEALPKYAKKFPVDVIDPEEDVVEPFAVNKIYSEELTRVELPPELKTFLEKYGHLLIDNSDDHLRSKK